MNDSGKGLHQPSYVPGYGVVYWPQRKLDAAAGRFATVHKPDSSWWWPTSWKRRRHCLVCGRRWRCPQSKWARNRLSHRNVTVTGLGEW